MKNKQLTEIEKEEENYDYEKKLTKEDCETIEKNRNSILKKMFSK